PRRADFPARHRLTGPIRPDAPDRRAGAAADPPPTGGRRMKKYSAMAPGDAPTVFYALPELHYPVRLNAVERLLEDAIARGWGARTAYLHHGGAISYDELRRDVHRTAIALRRIGIAAGDRVLLRLEDGPELVTAVLAAQAIGACVVPTYVQLRADGLITRANDCGAVAAIVAASLLDEFAGVPEQCPALAQTIVVPADPAGRLRAMDAIRPDEASACPGKVDTGFPTRTCANSS